MVVRLHEIDESQLGQGQFAGFRLSAEEFYELPDDSSRYELVNGVVVMSPSPTPAHQKVAVAKAEINRTSVFCSSFSAISRNSAAAMGMIRIAVSNMILLPYPPNRRATVWLMTGMSQFG